MCLIDDDNFLIFNGEMGFIFGNNSDLKKVIIYVIYIFY